MNELRRWDLKDLLVLLAGFTLLAVYSFAVSRDRILWSDEVLSWNLLADPSWRRMLAAWRLGADGGGLGFYVLGRVWLSIFGHSTLAYRGFSAFGCFVAYAATWRVLRRYYSAAVGLLVLLLVWFGSRTILWQLIQTRFYGLLLAAVALVLLMAVRSAEESTKANRLQAATLAGAFACNLLLIETHPFGLLYSCVVLAGCSVADRLRLGRRPWYYIAVVSSWPFLLFSRTAMLNSAKINKPWSWTLPPDRYALIEQFAPHSLPHIFWLYVLAALMIAGVGMLRKTFTKRWVQDRNAVIPALCLAGVPLLFYVLSRGGTSYFVDRYMIGAMVGVAVLTAELLSVFSASFGQKRSLGFAFALVAVFWLFKVGVDATMHYPQETFVPGPDFTVPVGRVLPRDVPIVVERPDAFLILEHYNRDPRLQLRYLLDWPYVIAPHSPHNLASGYHELEHRKAAGYDADDIVGVDRFLSQTNRFVVAEGQTRWFRSRILTDPRWQAAKIGEYRDASNNMWTTNVWMVQRRAGS